MYREECGRKCRLDCKMGCRLAYFLDRSLGFFLYCVAIDEHLVS